MKKLLLSAVAAIMLASCATNIVLYTDYSPLTQKGYYVSPAAVVPDGYTTIGEVLIKQESGFQKTKSTDYGRDAFNSSEGGIFDRKKSQTAKKNSNFKTYTSQTILDVLANEIASKNGDGIIGLSTTYEKEAIYLKGYIIKKK